MAINYLNLNYPLNCIDFQSKTMNLILAENQLKERIETIGTLPGMRKQKQKIKNKGKKNNIRM